jgi:hypothetical protein
LAALSCCQAERVSHLCGSGSVVLFCSLSTLFMFVAISFQAFAKVDQTKKKEEIDQMKQKFGVE